MCLCCGHMTSRRDLMVQTAKWRKGQNNKAQREETGQKKYQKVSEAQDHFKL